MFMGPFLSGHGVESFTHLQTKRNWFMFSDAVSLLSGVVQGSGTVILCSFVYIS